MRYNKWLIAFFVLASIALAAPASLAQSDDNTKKKPAKDKTTKKGPKVVTRTSKAKGVQAVLKVISEENQKLVCEVTLKNLKNIWFSFKIQDGTASVSDMKGGVAFVKKLGLYILRPNSTGKFRVEVALKKGDNFKIKFQRSIKVHALNILDKLGRFLTSNTISIKDAVETILLLEETVGLTQKLAYVAQAIRDGKALEAIKSIISTLRSATEDGKILVKILSKIGINSKTLLNVRNLLRLAELVTLVKGVFSASYNQILKFQ